MFYGRGALLDAAVVAPAPAWSPTTRRAHCRTTPCSRRCTATAPTAACSSPATPARRTRSARFTADTRLTARAVGP